MASSLDCAHLGGLARLFGTKLTLVNIRLDYRRRNSRPLTDFHVPWSEAQKCLPNGEQSLLPSTLNQVMDFGN